MRMCVVCREKFEKRSLVRIVKSDSGLHIDSTGKSDGRGAYLCHAEACWHRAAETNVLSKALRTELAQESRKELLQIFQKLIEP